MDILSETSDCYICNSRQMQDYSFEVGHDQIITY